MKTFIILFTIFVAGLAQAQTPKQSSQAPKPNGHAMTTVLPPKLEPGDLAIKLDKPNEIQRGRATYSGVAVQVMKCKEPWQLINPFAPTEYGSGRQNWDHDIITGKPAGFKFFSISF